MRILAFVNANSGPSYHRIIMPLLLMNDVDVFVTNNLLDEHFEKGCDIFMYNRILPQPAYGHIKELKEKYGFKICVDIDDYWELDEHHILYDLYHEEKFAVQQIEHISNADVVFTTHERLAEEIKAFNKNVHILPNAIPRKGQFDIKKEPHHLTRLFWQGSITHRKDIQLLATPIDRLASQATKIQMVMAGYVDKEDEWYLMALDYTAKCKHQYKLIPPANVNEYYAGYAHADICLVPLINSQFNRHKSNLKILEAANMGLPVVCSNIHPYLDMPVMYCNNSSDWIKNITRLIKSKKRQREAGEELKDFCDINYNFGKINSERKQIFEYEYSRVLSQ